MNYFDHLLSHVGVGATKVALELSDRNVRAGEIVRGYVVLRGGKVAQPLRSLAVEACVRVVGDYDDRTVYSTVPLHRVELAVPAAITPGATHIVPFALELPVDTPSGIADAPVILRATLDPWHGHRPVCEVALQVEPAPAAAATRDALTLLGYRLTRVLCVLPPVAPPGWGRPFLPEYHFCPEAASGPSELVAVFCPAGAGLDLYLEVSPIERGFTCYTGEPYRITQRYRHLWVASADCCVEQLAASLQRAIMRCPRVHRGSNAPSLWPGLRSVSRHPEAWQGYRGRRSLRRVL